MDSKILMQINEAYRHGVYAEETLSEEEYLDIQEWVEALIEEGYNLDDYSDEELYEAYLCELNKAEQKLGMSSWQAEIGRNKRYKNDHLRQSRRKPDSYFYDKRNLTPDSSSGETISWHDSMSRARRLSRKLNREELKLYEAYLEDLDESKSDKGLTPLQKIRKRNKEGNLVMPVVDQTSERRSYHKAGRGVKKKRGDKYDVGSTVGKDTWAREAEVKKRYGSHYDEIGRRERNVKAIKSQKKVGGPKGLPEELDLYDIVSEYLVSEGFCDSYEDADVIMANMSEEWRESIMEEVLDEASPTNPNLYKGKHGQSEKEYMDGRSRVGKEISGTSTETGAQRQIDRFNISGGRTPNRPGERPKQQPKLNYYARDILASQIHGDHNQGGARISRVTGKMTKYRM